MRAATRVPTTPQPTPPSSRPATTNDTCDSAIDRGSTCFDKSTANTVSYRGRIGGPNRRGRPGRRGGAGGGGHQGGGPCGGVRGLGKRVIVCTFGSMLGARSGVCHGKNEAAVCRGARAKGKRKNTYRIKKSQYVSAKERRSGTITSPVSSVSHMSNSTRLLASCSSQQTMGTMLPVSPLNVVAMASRR